LDAAAVTPFHPHSGPRTAHSFSGRAAKVFTPRNILSASPCDQCEVRRRGRGVELHCPNAPRIEVPDRPFEQRSANSLPAVLRFNHDHHPCRDVVAGHEAESHAHRFTDR